MENTFYQLAVTETLVKDVQEFLALDLKKPSLQTKKRTYFIHGKPGCGKTKFIMAMFHKYPIFQIPVEYVFSKDKKKGLAARFSKVMDSIGSKIVRGEPYVIVFDEIDKYWKGDVRDNYTGILCTWLDGLLSETGRIVVFTANSMKKFDLDSPLMRPGRMDMVVEFGLPDHYQLQQTVALYHPDWVIPENHECRCYISKVSSLLRDPGLDLDQFLQQATREVKDECVNEDREELEFVVDEESSEDESLTNEQVLDVALELTRKIWSRMNHCLALKIKQQNTLTFSWIKTTTYDHCCGEEIDVSRLHTKHECYCPSQYRWNCLETMDSIMYDIKIRVERRCPDLYDEYMTEIQKLPKLEPKLNTEELYDSGRFWHDVCNLAKKLVAN